MDSKETIEVRLLCLKCEQAFEIPQKKDDYLGHLFLEHRLVIAEVDEIAHLEDYLKYWIDEFKDHELEEYCTTMLLDQKPDGTLAKNERYYLLSDILPKDREIRQRLQQQRLSKALEQHKFELTDRNFSKECLYCRDVINGLRADYIAHLYQKHFLQIGKAENLVYIDELLSNVQYNLEHLICLYCEKIFKDRVTLKEHMRKKAHKRINPNNRKYDRFFLVNYRNESTRPSKQHQRKPQHQRKHNDGEKNVKTTDNKIRSLRSNSDDGDSDWSDWADEQQPAIACLYCQIEKQSFAALKTHMLDAHQVDFDGAVKALNFYSKIKIINYVRQQVYLKRCVTCNTRYESSVELLAHMASESHFGVGTNKQWDKPEYFFPFYPDDGLLCVLDDDSTNDVSDDAMSVPIISEDTVATQINKDAEQLSLENFSLF